MTTLTRITPCLWFDTQAEDAATFYTGVFDNSRIVQVSHYNAAGPRPAGMVLMVEFELDGQPLTALNGGPEFTFDEAISFQVNCESQEEIDRYWAAFADGGQEGPCGWVKDRYGVSWQIGPSALMNELVRDPDSGKAERAMRAMLSMGKIDMAEIQRAADQT